MSMVLTTPGGSRITLKPRTTIGEIPFDKMVVIETSDGDVHEGYCPCGGETFTLGHLPGDYILIRKLERPSSAGQASGDEETKYLTCLVYVDEILGWGITGGAMVEDAEIIEEILTKENLKQC